MQLCKKGLEKAGVELKVSEPGVAGGGDKLKSPVVTEISNFSATKRTSLLTLVTAEIRSECKCEEHNQRRRGCCAA